MKVVEERGKMLLSCLRKKGTTGKSCNENCMICEGLQEGYKNILNCNEEIFNYEKSADCITNTHTHTHTHTHTSHKGFENIIYRDTLKCQCFIL